MEHRDKRSRSVVDKETKMIKKLIKNEVIVVPKTIQGGYFDGDLSNSKIKITNIRKYQSYYGYVYEIDVIVDMNTSEYFRSNYRCQARSRMFNGWYRNSILNIINSESTLKYFNIDVSRKSIISKIKYQTIG